MTLNRRSGVQRRHCAIAQSDGAGCVDVAISICAGTLITGLFGPILCGCRTVLKIWVGVGVGGFGVPHLGFRTGTGKPAVLLKRVPQVRVWFWFLAHHNTPCTCAAVLWVLTGLLWYSCPWFFYFKLPFLSFFIIFYSLCHNVMEPNMARLAARTSLLFTINLPPLTPTCIPLQNIVSGCSKYQN
jgi:hypothetical protein